ncbi:MAG: ECF transporter S component [Oscillospiraceae bacterium]|jgi:riboflavin transporter FmnP|nr:MAG: ECF transporter S component [Oscillospiraceae bacterium]
MKNSTQKLNRIAATSIFAAIAYLSMFLTPFRVDFLTFDIKDAVMTIGALYLGPLAGLAMSAVTSLLEMFTISQTGIDGMIMNFVGSATYTVVAALIYTYRKSLKNAVLGLVAATLSMTAVMLAANLIITPGFKGVPVEAVIAMIPTLLLPFNLLKGILNAALVMLLYKPVTTAMRATRLAVGEQHKGTNKNTIIVTLVSLAVIAAALVFFFTVLDAKLGG